MLAHPPKVIVEALESLTRTGDFEELRQIWRIAAITALQRSGSDSPGR